MEEDYVNGYGYPLRGIRSRNRRWLSSYSSRIPYGQNSSAEEGRPVALLMHGLLVTSLLDVTEIFRHTPLLTILLTILCRDGSALQPICLALLYNIGGPTDQTVTVSEFRQYDYGLIGNLVKYKQLIAPEYPLENVTVPVAIFIGSNDLIASPPIIDGLLC
ncbi:hypothetical protein NQ317_002273 [Molorchus minor]|uniref:Uncharacterized protein n=1 Tax=Molorchus minor TaxID=1323400 RepID=A0ABQ9J4N4_9CUCU|nr:hypothetical protein NQ317_002273 [Molorchus minor]